VISLQVINRLIELGASLLVCCALNLTACCGCDRWHSGNGLRQGCQGRAREQSRLEPVEERWVLAIAWGAPRHENCVSLSPVVKQEQKAFEKLLPEKIVRRVLAVRADPDDALFCCVQPPFAPLTEGLWCPHGQRTTGEKDKNVLSEVLPCLLRRSILTPVLLV
jgi:hypothetical protein